MVPTNGSIEPAWYYVRIRVLEFEMRQVMKCTTTSTKIPGTRYLVPGIGTYLGFLFDLTA